jgi:hypothetical protein
MSHVDRRSYKDTVGSFHSEDDKRSLQDEASDRIRLAQEYQNVLDSIRQIDGFERFLLPKPFSTLAHASKGGPVVLINVHESRCDALIVCSPADDLIHVCLPKLSHKGVSAMHQQFLNALTFAGVRERGARDHTDSSNQDRAFKTQSSTKNDYSRILLRLWLHVVHPVLEAIEGKVSWRLIVSIISLIRITQLHSSTVDVLPHVTWCATGPLAFLPLHAAGEYGQDGGRKVFDFVVSSYTPTLSTLLQKPISLANFRSSSTKILVVSQPQTPQLSRLPGSLEEVTKIRDHFEEGQIIHKNDPDATINAVLQEINDHHPLCIHLACHGVQDADDPTGSAFFLYDGKLELRQLMAASVAGATLAFLSACQTAKGDAKLPEEAVHLAAGMLAVGYRAVIGTLWSIGDEDAPLVADEFYRRMKKDQTDVEGRVHAAYALHGATEVLRKEVGESNFHRWAAFVHFGL